MTFATDAEAFAYRFGHLTRETFFALYYPKTDRFTDAQLLTLIDAQAPGYDTESLAGIVSLDRDESLVLNCHVARLYERRGALSLETAYIDALGAWWERVRTEAGAGATDAEIDAVTDRLEPVKAPAMLAVARTRELIQKGA